MRPVLAAWGVSKQPHEGKGGRTSIKLLLCEKLSLYIILHRFYNTVHGRHFNPHFIEEGVKAQGGR